MSEHARVVWACLAVATIVTLVDLVLEASGNPGFDPQPLYVFLALVLGQQGAKASTEKGKDE